ncbi:MAG: polysaccharide deacetylase family protein [Rhodocyclaceae bacterium]|nr:polysaccharide deacetylase family protein [Rhodocyclaceae bacterium]
MLAGSPGGSVNPPRRWRPSPLLLASAALHVLLVPLLVAWPRHWPWLVAALVVDHLLLTAAGLWPRSRVLGPNLRRLPPSAACRGEVALTIDDGPDPEITPQVLDILEHHGARASFFCIGTRAETHPALIADIARRGHSIENHSQHHRHGFSLLGPWRMHAEIAAAQRSLQRLAGRPPRYFRAPAGLRNPFLEPVLARLGLDLASWTRRGFDTRVGDPERVLARLVRDLDAGDILLLHDGHAARDPDSGSAVILVVLPRLLEALDAAGLSAVTLPRPGAQDRSTVA